MSDNVHKARHGAGLREPEADHSEGTSNRRREACLWYANTDIVLFFFIVMIWRADEEV